jgi:hypothetical protein
MDGPFYKKTPGWACTILPTQDEMSVEGLHTDFHPSTVGVEDYIVGRVPLDEACSTGDFPLELPKSSV